MRVFQHRHKTCNDSIIEHFTRNTGSLVPLELREVVGEQVGKEAETNFCR